MPRKSKADTTITYSWQSLLWPLVLLVIAGSLIAYYVPSLPNSSASIFHKTNGLNSHSVMALASLSGATLIYLAYCRAKFGFSKAWLIAAALYNFMVLFIKLTLSNHELTNQTTTNFGHTLLTSLAISLLYIFAFTLLYLFFEGKLLNKKLHKALIVDKQGKVLLAMGLFIVATLARVVIFRLPFFSDSSASTYLNEVFKADNTLISAVLFVMVLAAVESYSQVRRKIDLKYFYVVGVLLLLVFHLWWAIFVYRGHT